ncbi:MAG: hypothetical protein IPI35_25960 [Deltaproteobacteria bacterium]|nr:hypothetical protein [Deltaproteobacteria bacterium]
MVTPFGELDVQPDHLAHGRAALEVQERALLGDGEGLGVLIGLKHAQADRERRGVEGA